MAETEKQKDIYILGIESSCDETAASVVKNGREVLSNVISSQIALHTLYGGVVPEIASRKHIEKINQVIEQALALIFFQINGLTAGNVFSFAVIHRHAMTFFDHSCGKFFNNYFNTALA